MEMVDVEYVKARQLTTMVSTLQTRSRKSQSLWDHTRKDNPYAPEQNGVAEQLNCMLIEITRAMLLDLKLLQGFWAEKVSTAAANLMNRSPTSAVEEMTSDKARYGNKPEVEHVRVFATALCKFPRNAEENWTPRL